MLVSFFRNPILLKGVGTTVVVVFLLALVGYRNFLRFVVPSLFICILFFLVRRWVMRRKMKLTELEEEYLEKRFYKH
jgi:hypothetical protein